MLRYWSSHEERKSAYLFITKFKLGVFNFNTSPIRMNKTDRCIIIYYVIGYQFGLGSNGLWPNTGAPENKCWILKYRRKWYRHKETTKQCCETISFSVGLLPWVEPILKSDFFKKYRHLKIRYSGSRCLRIYSLLSNLSSRYFTILLSTVVPVSVGGMNTGQSALCLTEWIFMEQNKYDLHTDGATTGIFVHEALPNSSLLKASI